MTTSITKLSGLNEWVFTKKINPNKRQAEVSIYLKYPPIKTLLSYSPAERKDRIKQLLSGHLNKLLNTIQVDNYTLIGSTSKPRGITTTIPFSLLKKIAKMPYVGLVFIINIRHAKKLKPAKKAHSYYCVKMTVVCEIEGRKKGFQTMEERFVLIKANSFEQAYKKMEKQKKAYEEPYLNAYGECVRWKIERFDDCFLTDIHTLEDLNAPEGIEVFSAFKPHKRKITSLHYWDGKPNS